MTFHAIGLMSGTSLDGLDLCFAEFEKTGTTWRFRFLKAETLPYSEDWENKLRNSILLSAQELLELHSEYGYYLGKQVKEFINCIDCMVFSRFLSPVDNGVTGI